MRKILVTGGTVFVSHYAAEYFAQQGDEVYVLNRGSKPQPEGVTPIIADRHALGDLLKGYDFDAVLDITAYTRRDVEDLVKALGSVKDYIFISSSAVYPETLPQPFTETQPPGLNSIWGAYGSNKLDAEQWLAEHLPQSYILRPPYLYGPMQNVYREPFVFECAEKGRSFYIPKDGSMKMQFFHVEDLCSFMDILLKRHPEERIYNVGNAEAVSIDQWVELCYEAVGMPLEKRYVNKEHAQRSYFPFHDYDYYLDVSRQNALMPDTKPMLEGLKEEYAWYRTHREDMVRKRYSEYIDEYLRSQG